MKNILDKLGIVVALLLSIVLVLMLIVTPIAFSALSLLNADTITSVVVNALTAGVEEDQAAAKTAEIATLSNSAQSAATDIGENFLKEILGDTVGQEGLQAILSSKVVEELIKAYTNDLTNAIVGNGQAESFTADKVKGIVNGNLDEIVQLLQTNIPELADMDTEELKSKIQTAVDEGLEEMMDALPKPADIKEQLAEGAPMVKTALEILSAKGKIKATVVGIIVALSALIFVCRIFELRGFRWLATDLFIGTGINVFTLTGLMVGKTAVGEIAEIAGAQAAALVDSLLSAFTTGILSRTVVMLICGGVLLAIHIFIRKKKQADLEVTSQAQAAAEWM